MANPDDTYERLRSLEAWLSNLYKDAEDDLREKWDAYLKAHEDKGNKLQAKIAAAKTDAERKAAEKAYKDYLKSITDGSKWYRDMVRETAEQYSQVNARALQMINGERTGFYADGYNLTAGEVNDVAIREDVGIRFDMCSAEAVDWLAENRGRINLPPAETLNYTEDERWSAKLLNSQVAQGIVQGESIPKIAGRISNVTGAVEVSAVRAARTMATECQNAGRVQAMTTAEGWGVQTRKKWVCTHDRRTRDNHLLLDGETIDHDGVFWNGCRWPGDHLGPPEEVWNCRCTLVTVVDGFKSTLPKGKEDAITVSIDGKEVHKRRSDEQTYPLIAGVKRGDPMDHVAADNGKVNPHFSDGIAYQINCQSCVVTYEARRRGYDTEVVGNDKNHPMCERLSKNALMAFKNKDGSEAEYVPGFDGHYVEKTIWQGKKPTAKTALELLEKTVEDGARYEMAFQWRGNSRIGHIVTLEKRNGTLILYDPQSDYTYRGDRLLGYMGKIKYETSFYGMKYYRYPRLLRVDDKEFAYDVVGEVMEARKK